MKCMIHLLETMRTQIYLPINQQTQMKAKVFLQTNQCIKVTLTSYQNIYDSSTLWLLISNLDGPKLS